MKLNGLHLLLTYQCTFECDHCFVWGSPWQTGTMTIEMIRLILHQAMDAGSVEWIYFEGGEPFLYYQTMLAGISEAVNMGFMAGIVTNGYWATSEEDATLFLAPLAGKIHDLSISSDLFHYSEKISQQSKYITKVAESLHIPVWVITIEQPDCAAATSVGQIPPESSSIMYRGRAADKLASKTNQYPPSIFTSCSFENLTDPGRVHLDPLGNLHICQGISLGNILQTTLKEICKHYKPFSHPIIGPLLEGGPYKLAVKYHLLQDELYADACHLCYETRKRLRNRFPKILAPDQMYMVSNT
jgi:hypothetical protein